MTEALPAPASDPLSRLNAAAPPSLADRARRARLVGERKPVTAVFADIVGSTSLQERIDPEEWTEIINVAFDAMSSRIFEYEGTIAQLLGDAIVSFFGAPVAHEDDPERAVRAALAMIADIDAYGGELEASHGIDFSIRIGISTGLVLVGNVGSDLRYDYTAVGDTMNLASRLQGEALPGGIIIADRTERFVRPFFEFEDVGELELKGKTDTVRAYRVLGERAEPLPTRGVAGLTSPMVGRDNEREVLAELAATARAGRGRVAIVVADPGLGKSRLLLDLRQSLTTREATDPSTRETAWVTGHGTSYGRRVPFGLIASLVRDLIGVGPSDPPDIVTVALRRTVETLVPDDREVYGFVAHLLGVPLDDEAREIVGLVQGELLEERLTGAMLRLVKRAASQGPLVLAIEDLHWADVASVELVKAILTLADEAAVLVICTTREDIDADGWSVVTTARERIGRALTEIRLEPLSAEDTQGLVANLLAIESLSGRTRRLILDKAEGNPFFVEEVIRMLIEREAIERHEDRWVATGTVEMIEIPDTLHGLMLARIDRLPPDARRLLRIASCIERRFSVPLLETVALEGGVEGPIGASLTRLEAADLIVLASTDPELEYRFSHALIADAAYETVLHKERRDWHGLVAEAMISREPEREDELADRLAHHFEQAGEAERAIVYLLISGKRAMARAALRDARELYLRAERLVDELPQEDNDTILRQRLAIALGRIATGHLFMTTEAGFDLVAKAEAWAERLDERSALVDLLLWETLLRRGRGETPENSPDLGRTEARIEALGDVETDHVQRSQTLFQAGLMNWFAGDFEASVQALEGARRLMEGRGDVVGAAMAEGYLAANRATAGAFDEADERMEAARELADRADALSRLDYHLAESAIAALRGDYATSRRFAAECLAGSTEMGALGCATVSGIILGGAQMGLGNGPGARVTLEKSLELATQGYLAPMRQRGNVYLASATGMSGDLGAAEEAFRSALTTYASMETPFAAAEARLFRGLVLAQHPGADANEGVAELDAAIVTFESVGARPALARALRARGIALMRLERPDDADASLARSALLAAEMGLLDGPWPASAKAFSALDSTPPPIDFIE